MKKEHAFLYGGFFAFLPRVRGFLLETVFPERAVCRTCGRITGGGILCGGCRSRLLSDGMTMAWDREELEPDLDAYILRPHTGVARQLVLRLKHSAEKCLADELADLLLPVPSYISFPPETVVTWVPMPESRRRERCIDHGKALAEAAASPAVRCCFGWKPGTGRRRPWGRKPGRQTSRRLLCRRKNALFRFSWWTTC